MMNLIKTKNFELAANVLGDQNSLHLALVLPGRLDSKDYPHMKSHTEFLAQRGFLAVTFDPPGTWESPGNIELYTMTNYLKAINELIEYFGNRPTLTLGHSRGGSMSILTGVTNPTVTHFVSIMGRHSYTQGMAGSTNTTWQERGYLSEKRDDPSHPEQTRFFNLPYGSVEDSLKYSMTESLRNCPKPKLFIYGTNDTTTEPKIVKEGYELSLPPKEIVALESDHNYRVHPNLIKKVNQIVSDFLNKYPL